MIYVFLANGFEEVEALAPVDMLRRAKLDVTTVGVTGKIVTGSHRIPVTADITAEELQIGADMEMIVLPGGMPGTLNEEASETIQAAIDYCAKNDRWIGAICAAPSILGHKGLLQGKTATCYTGFEKDLLGAEIRQRRRDPGRQVYHCPWRWRCRRLRSGTGRRYAGQGGAGADPCVDPL